MASFSFSMRFRSSVRSRSTCCGEGVLGWCSRALEESAGNKAEAARRLGIHRRLLYEKLKEFGMVKDDEETAIDNQLPLLPSD